MKNKIQRNIAGVKLDSKLGERQEGRSGSKKKIANASNTDINGMT